MRPYGQFVRQHSTGVGAAMMLISGISLNLGASIAVVLFAYFPPVIVAWLRVASSALVLTAIVRPRRLAWQWQNLWPATIYGLSALGMNMTFYLAIARVPLGLAVALEFLGPVVVAAYSSRNLRDAVAIASALAGVVLIAGVSPSSNFVGLIFCFLAAFMTGAYIVAGGRLARRSVRVKELEAVSNVQLTTAPEPQTLTVWDSMAVGFTCASLVTAPVWLFNFPGIRTTLGLPLLHGGALSMWQLLGAAFVVGMLSALVPFAMDQMILRLVPTGTFAVLAALLPVVAAVIGWLVLGQTLGVWECAGIAAIILAVVLRSR